MAVVSPPFHSVIEGNEIVHRDYIDISVAVATPKVGGALVANLACTYSAVSNYCVIIVLHGCRVWCDQYFIVLHGCRVWWYRYLGMWRP